jgi:hypothetical protein
LDHAAAAGDRVIPHPHPAEVDLGDLTRRRRWLAHGRVFGTHHADPLAHVTPERCQPYIEPALVTHSLPHGGHRAALQPRRDLVVELRDPLFLVADPAAHPVAVHQPHPRRPLAVRDAIPAAGEPSHGRLLGDRRHSVAAHPGAASDLPIGLPGVPEPEDFHHVCHIEPPAGHSAPP